MPHYADGSAAQVGDLVTGKPYSTKQPIVGVMVQIMAGPEACNCIVAFVHTFVTPLPLHTFDAELPVPLFLRRPVGGVGAGESTSMENLVIAPRTDYGTTAAFSLVARA